MEIILKEIGKKFGDHWIFRKITLTFQAGDRWAIVGPNGSGKSTLLKLLAGLTIPSEGAFAFLDQKKIVAAEKRYRHIAYAAPYLQLPEELTVAETARLYFKLKSPNERWPGNEFPDISGLNPIRNKRLNEISSGQLQRLKLTLAAFADTPFLMLDEPLTNLDQDGEAYYQQLISQQSDKRTLLVCSNLRETETKFCTATVEMDFYKP